MKKKSPKKIHFDQLDKMKVVFLKNKTTPADPYHDLFSSFNNEVSFIPLLEHEHLDKTEIVKYLTGPFVDADVFIVTSQRAVECFNESIAMIKDEQISKIIKSMPGYTVGPATADILSKAGFQDVRGGADAGNGSILSEIIIKELPTLKKIVFFTGEIRKDIIPRKLILAGYNFKERILYRTKPRDDIVENFENIKIQLQGSKLWLVFFSPQGTEAIVQYLQENNDHKFNIASIGPTTEEYLIEKGIYPQIVAAKPTAQSLYDAITSLAQM